MPIQQVQFRTTPSAARQETFGEGLANLVVKGMQTATQIEKQQYQAKAEDSSLLLVDAKIQRKEALTALTRQLGREPNAAEMRKFNDEIRANQSEVYGAMVESDQKKYDLYYAAQDGEVASKEIKEAKVIEDSFLSEAALEIYDTQEADHIASQTPTIDKKSVYDKIFDTKNKDLEARINSGEYDNVDITEVELRHYGELLVETKDKRLTDSANAVLAKLKQRQTFFGSLHAGMTKDQAWLAAGKPKDKDKLYKNHLSSLIAVGRFGEAIAIDNSNGGQGIAYLNNLDDQLKISPESALSAYKIYKNTQYGGTGKGQYVYPSKVKQAFETYEAVAEAHGFDLADTNGLLSVQNIINSPLDQKIIESDLALITQSWASKAIEDTAQLVTLGLWKNGYIDKKYAPYILSEAKKVEKYMSKEDALKYATNKIKNEFVNVNFGISKTKGPVGNFGATGSKDIEIMKRELSHLAPAKDNAMPSDVSADFDPVTQNWLVKVKDKHYAINIDQMALTLRRGRMVSEAIDVADVIIKSGAAEGVKFDKKAETMSKFFDKGIDKVLKKNGLKLSKQEIQRVKIEVLNKYKQKIGAVQGMKISIGGQEEDKFENDPLVKAQNYFSNKMGESKSLTGSLAKTIEENKGKLKLTPLSTYGKESMIKDSKKSMEAVEEYIGNVKVSKQPVESYRYTPYNMIDDMLNTAFDAIGPSKAEGSILAVKAGDQKVVSQLGNKAMVIKDADAMVVSGTKLDQAFGDGYIVLADGNSSILEPETLLYETVQGADNNDMNEVSQELKLSNVLKHDDLYKLRPEVANKKISFFKSDNKDLYGYYNPSSDKLFVNADIGEDEIHSTILHEVSHAIALDERLDPARGGLPQVIIDSAMSSFDKVKNEFSEEFMEDLTERLPIFAKDKELERLEAGYAIGYFMQDGEVTARQIAHAKDETTASGAMNVMIESGVESGEVASKNIGMDAYEFMHKLADAENAEDFTSNLIDIMNSVAETDQDKAAVEKFKKDVSSNDFLRELYEKNKNKGDYGPAYDMRRDISQWHEIYNADKKLSTSFQKTVAKNMETYQRGNFGKKQNIMEDNENEMVTIVDNNVDNVFAKEMESIGVTKQDVVNMMVPTYMAETMMGTTKKVSNTGALGEMQVLPSTAKDLIRTGYAGSKFAKAVGMTKAQLKGLSDKQLRDKLLNDKKFNILMGVAKYMQAIKNKQNKGK